MNMPRPSPHQFPSEVPFPIPRSLPRSSVLNANLPLPSSLGTQEFEYNIGHLSRPPTSRGITPTRYPRYKFYAGICWAAKPGAKGHAYPANTVIGAWATETLSRYNSTYNVAKQPGEDFFFIQKLPQDSGIALGVADGVGSWTNKGVDPAVFSQALMYYCNKVFLGEIARDNASRTRRPSPRDCLKLAYDVTLTDTFVKAGSCTACLISLDAQSGILQAANIGDTGFCIIRSGSVVFQSRIQLHGWNYPKQLTKNIKSSKRPSSRGSDSPRDADTYKIQLRDGDIIIAYTDGLMDNIYPSELVDICSVVLREHRPERDRPKVMADRIADYARQCMRNKTLLTPFEREAIKQGVAFKGGKLDDITVIVTLVCER